MRILCPTLCKQEIMFHLGMQWIKALLTAALLHYIHKDFHEAAARMTLIDCFLFLVKINPTFMQAVISLLSVNILLFVSDFEIDEVKRQPYNVL